MSTEFKIITPEEFREGQSGRIDAHLMHKKVGEDVVLRTRVGRFKSLHEVRQNNGLEPFFVNYAFAEFPVKVVNVTEKAGRTIVATELPPCVLGADQYIFRGMKAFFLGNKSSRVLEDDGFEYIKTIRPEPRNFFVHGSLYQPEVGAYFEDDISDFEDPYERLYEDAETSQAIPV